MSTILVEQSTKKLGAILGDLDRLREEFSALNVQEFHEACPDMDMATYQGLEKFEQELSRGFFIIHEVKKRIAAEAQGDGA